MAEVVAETERLRLREWFDEDEARFYEIMNQPAVMRYLGGMQTPEEWSAAFSRIRRYQREFGFTFWIIADRQDAEILGFCGLKRANAPGAVGILNEVEIGWRLREDCWGKGLAKEAAVASLDLAFGRFLAPRVVAVTSINNLPSQGLMKRLGMKRMPGFDFVDERFPADSEVNPQVVFQIDAGEWSAAREAALA